MGHPFRRYCYHLARELGKDIHEIMSMPSHELSEWMAFDLTNNDEWLKKYEEDREKEISRNMSNADKAKLFKQLLGGA